jgi:hypothetical protein
VNYKLDKVWQVEHDFCKALCAVLGVEQINDVLKVYLKLRADRQEGDGKVNHGD